MQTIWQPLQLPGERVVSTARATEPVVVNAAASPPQLRLMQHMHMHQPRLRCVLHGLP